MNLRVKGLVSPDSEGETKTSSGILEPIIYERPEGYFWGENPVEVHYIDWTYATVVTGIALTPRTYQVFGGSTSYAQALAPVVDLTARARRVNDILRPAKEKLTSFSNESLVSRAVSILDGLYNALMKHDVKKYKSIMAFEDKDCITLEWIYPHWRLGFALDQNPKDDSWYLLSDEAAGDIQASGYSILDGIDLIIYWLIKKL